MNTRYSERDIGKKRHRIVRANHHPTGWHTVFINKDVHRPRTGADDQRANCRRLTTRSSKLNTGETHHQNQKKRRDMPRHESHDA